MCEDMNRNTKGRFRTVDGMIEVTTAYCPSCYDCIDDWRITFTKYMFGTEANKQLQNHMWTLSHSKRGYFVPMCITCVEYNMTKKDRYAIDENGLKEKLSYCKNCSHCSYEITNSYREKIGSLNSKNFANKTKVHD